MLSCVDRCSLLDAYEQGDKVQHTQEQLSTEPCTALAGCTLQISIDNTVY